MWPIFTCVYIYIYIAPHRRGEQDWKSLHCSSAKASTAVVGFPRPADVFVSACEPGQNLCNHRWWQQLATMIQEASPKRKDAFSNLWKLDKEKEEEERSNEWVEQLGNPKKEEEKEKIEEGRKKRNNRKKKREKNSSTFGSWAHACTSLAFGCEKGTPPHAQRRIRRKQQKKFRSSSVVRAPGCLARRPWVQFPRVVRLLCLLYFLRAVVGAGGYI